MLLYSIYIRTLGKGGEKYKKLLDSIDKQSVRPQEVVVVLPKGYDLPKERLGYERFVFSDKGMVKQRLFSIYDVNTPYILLLDDDVEFESEYVEKIFATMIKANAQCCIPIMYDDSLHPSFLRHAVERFVGVATYKNTHDNFYIKINKCGGLILNNKLKQDVQYYSQTGHGSNCFAETKVLKEIHFEDELWLEESSYPLPEDQVMFYKIYQSGYKIAVCKDIYFRHLNAASTNDGKRYIKMVKAKVGNYLIFWYKFLYKDKTGFNKLLSILSICHRLFWECLFCIVKYHNLKVCKSLYLGLKYGFIYIRQH